MMSECGGIILIFIATALRDLQSFGIAEVIIRRDHNQNHHLLVLNKASDHLSDHRVDILLVFVHVRDAG